MSRAFQYRPKFVDIRVRPPKEGEDEKPDVHSLKPGERACDHAGCRTAASAKAPKSRDMPGQYYWFCQPHAAEYNRNWDFFAGMNAQQVAQAQAARAHGDRPTWQFKASRLSREAANFSAKAGAGYADPFGMFGAAGTKAAAPAPKPRQLGKLERNALADLDLTDEAQGPEIRARYTALVKRCHPDANGGDRSAEAKLQRVIKAYKTLQKAKLL